MQKSLLTALSAVAILSLGAACGNGSSSGTGAGSTTGTSSGGHTGSCPDNLTVPDGSDFCAAGAAAVDCSLVTAADKYQICGVAEEVPTIELKRSSGLKEFAGSGPPDLSCFQPANYPKAGTPGTAKAKGVVKIFSNGCESKQVSIEFHTVKRTGDDQDGSLGPLIGTAVTTPADCQATGVATQVAQCGTRYECTYEYDGVPTETELVVLTQGSLWAPLYDYNIFISNSDPKLVNGEWTHDVRALASDDYTVIPQAAIGSPVTPGNGVVAGEVHDCGDVRLSGALVNVAAQNRALTYFTSDEDSPLPDLAATSTSVLGLYAAFDMSPGPVSVAAIGMLNGKMETVGFYKVRVFKDSVTAVSFSGIRPYQVPAGM